MGLKMNQCYTCQIKLLFSFFSTTAIFKYELSFWTAIHSLATQILRQIDGHTFKYFFC